MTDQLSLLAVVEFLGHGNLKALYDRLGYQTTLEFSVRKAIALLRKAQPAVIVADFYHQPDFRDRVSNLESLLATAQRLPTRPKTLVFYEPSHQPALDKLKQRFQIDAALTLPVKEAELEALLRSWL